MNPGFTACGVAGGAGFVGGVWTVIFKVKFGGEPWERAMLSNSLPGLDFGLGSDIEMLRDTVRDFAQDKITPRAAEIDSSNSFPRDLWPELGALGLLGITVEEGWGGAGLGYLAHCV